MASCRISTLSHLKKETCNLLVNLFTTPDKKIIPYLSLDRVSIARMTLDYKMQNGHLQTLYQILHQLERKKGGAPCTCLACFPPRLNAAF